MESFLECSICLENYGGDDDRTPIVLECGHTFCKTCVMAIYGSLNNKCPNCRNYIFGRPQTRNLLLLGMIADRNAAEERNQRERFDRCVARGVALLVADPEFCPTRALFVDVLFPEVGLIVDPTVQRPLVVAADTVSDDTLGRLVRLVVAVFTHATVVSHWQARPVCFSDRIDKFFYTATYVLRCPPDFSMDMRGEMMRVFLMETPPPPPPCPDSAAMDTDTDGDTPPIAPPVAVRPRLIHTNNANRAVRRRRTFAAQNGGGGFRVVHHHRAAGNPPALVRPTRPAVTDSFWDATLAAAEHFGGLFAGGPAGCVWTHIVVPKLYGSFNGPLLHRTSKHQNTRNTELLRLMEVGLEPKLGVSLGSDDGVVVTIIRDAATSRRAINRIGHYLLGSRMGPEGRPLSEPEIRGVMSAHVAVAAAASVIVVE
jgi:hypothetical protein